MLTKKSRYKNALPFGAPDVASAPSAMPPASMVFRGLRARPIGPATGVVEHEIKADDRLDHLARHYYNDDRLWWRIVDANPQFSFGPDMLGDAMAGRVILIPMQREAQA